jgi:hypothetical protein
MSHLDINVDRIDAQKKSTLSSVSSEHDSSGSSISNELYVLNSCSSNHEQISLQNNQQSNITMTSKINIRKNSKDFHLVNTPVIQIKKSLSPGQDSSNFEQNNQGNIQIFQYEIEESTADYANPDEDHPPASDNPHNANETTVSFQQNNHYEDLDSSSISSNFDHQCTREIFFKHMITDDIQNEPLDSFRR